jgi:PAS domain S-box-containing protein
VSKGVSKRARNALSLRQLDQARWAAVLDTARDAIVSTDRDGIVTLFNRAAEEIFGYSASEVLGENIRMLMPPPYQEEHDQYLQNYHRTHVTKVIGRIRYVEGRRKNGEVFPIEVSVSEAQVGDEVLFTAIIRDATERKRMEEALRRERDFAERLVEAAEAIVLVRDLEGRIVLYNPYMEKISGLPLAETKGKNWFSTFLPAPERQRAREVFIQTLCDGEATGYFSSLLTRGGGSSREIEWHTRVLRDAQGSVSGVLSIGQDITERRSAERHLAAQYAVTRVLAEADSLTGATPRLLEAICMAAGWDLGELWYVDSETQTLRLDGVWYVPALDAAEYVSVSETMSFARGEGLPGMVWASGDAVLISDLSKAKELVRAALLRNLELRAAFASPIFIGGDVAGVICFFDRGLREFGGDLVRVLEGLGRQIGDFVERKRSEDAVRYSEARFEAFMNNSPATAFMKDEAGRMIYVNKPYERVFHTSLEAVYGKNDFELWPLEVAEQLRAHDLEVLTSNKPLEVLEQAPTPDKGMREWLSFKFPITDAAGQRFLASMGIDVTERRRAEAQLLELQKLAQERARLADIGAITAKIAHDLGNPLSGLSMQAQLVLQRARRDPTQPLGNVVKPVEQLVSEVRRLEGLIREFLSFAREQRLDLQQIELPHFLREVLNVWQPVASAHQIALKLDTTESPKQIEADEGKLRRVLDNLLKNAIEAIDSGPGEVKIVASIASPDKLRISVEDDGCGIPDSVQLFRLFETTKAQGSGLGLAVSKQIVLAHGGDLLFSPREPRGAAFHVELPLHRLSS